MFQKIITYNSEIVLLLVPFSFCSVTIVCRQTHIVKLQKKLVANGTSSQWGLGFSVSPRSFVNGIHQYSLFMPYIVIVTSLQNIVFCYSACFEVCSLIHKLSFLVFFVHKPAKTNQYVKLRLECMISGNIVNMEFYSRTLREKGF